MYLSDLLTPCELARLKTRVQIALCLLDGERWQDIARALHVSTATIAKVYAMMQKKEVNNGSIRSCCRDCITSDFMR